LGFEAEFVVGFGDALLKLVLYFGAAFGESFHEDIYAGGSKEYGEGLVSELSFEVEAAFNIYIENNGFAIGPNLFYFAPEGSVKDAGVDFFVFEEGSIFDFFSEIIELQEVIFSAVEFTRSGVARGCAH
jgi:hypothetical protein